MALQKEPASASREGDHFAALGPTEIRKEVESAAAVGLDRAAYSLALQKALPIGMTTEAFEEVCCLSGLHNRSLMPIEDMRDCFEVATQTSIKSWSAESWQGFIHALALVADRVHLARAEAFARAGALGPTLAQYAEKWARRSRLRERANRPPPKPMEWPVVERYEMVSNRTRRLAPSRGELRPALPSS
jgi:hypothetical protein